MLLKNLGIIVLLFTAILLAGCGPTYHSWDGSSGYSDAPVANGQYEVSFVATNRESPTQARYYATVRSAEVALQNNKPFFEILLVREGGMLSSQYIPENDTITTTRGPRGTRTSFTTVNRTGGYVAQYNYPICTLTIRLLDQTTPAALNTADTLRQAMQQQVPLTDFTKQKLATGG